MEYFPLTTAVTNVYSSTEVDVGHVMIDTNKYFVVLKT